MGCAGAIAPWVRAQRTDRDLAISEIQEVAQMYVEVLIEDGRSVPQEDDSTTEESIVIEVWV